jgi:hypothetical protein
MKFVQKQVLHPLCSGAQQRPTPEISSKVRQLLCQGQHHHLEHQQDGKVRIVLIMSNQLQKVGGLAEVFRNLNQTHAQMN